MSTIHWWWLKRWRATRAAATGPTTGVLTEGGDYLLTEGSDFIIQE